VSGFAQLDTDGLKNGRRDRRGEESELMSSSDSQLVILALS